MVEPRQQAPGCFGAASVYSMDSQVCQGCVAFQQCGDESLKTLESIREIINVKDLLVKHQAARKRSQEARIQHAAPQPVEQSPIPVAQPKPITKPVERKTTVERVTFTASPEEQAVIMRMEKNKKTQAQAIVLCKQNKVEAMRRQLPKGINPFATSGPGFMRVACSMVIEGGFTKAGLKTRLMQELTWTDGTAASHVAMVSALLFAFGIVKVEGDKFVLNPALGCDTIVSA